MLAVKCVAMVVAVKFAVGAAVAIAVVGVDAVAMFEQHYAAVGSERENLGLRLIKIHIVHASQKLKYFRMQSDKKNSNICQK